MTEDTDRMSAATDHLLPPTARRAGGSGDRQEYIGITEAGQRFGLSRDTLARAARDGNLETRRTGKLWLTTPAAVETWLKGARHRPGRKPQRRPLETPPATAIASLEPAV